MIRQLEYVLLPWRDPNIERGGRRTDLWTIGAIGVVAGVGVWKLIEGRFFVGTIEFVLAGLLAWTMRRRHQNKRFYDHLLLWFDTEIAMAGLITCPGCDLVLPADDLWGQQRHMMEEHPEIIEDRRREAARWDGWELD